MQKEDRQKRYQRGVISRGGTPKTGGIERVEEERSRMEKRDLPGQKRRENR